MNLFILENNIAKPNLETLLIEPFKTIWERDTDEHKSQAIKEFTFIEFFCSPKKSNPFAGYSEDVRDEKIIEVIFKNTPNWKPDEEVQEAVELYKQFFFNSSPTLNFLNAAKEGAKKLQDFFLNFDLNEKTKAGTPVYKPKEISTALSDSFNVMKTLNSLDEKVQQEIYEAVKTKGNRDVNPFEERVN